MILGVIITLCSDLAGPFNRGNLVGADCLFELVERFENSFFFFKVCVEFCLVLGYSKLSTGAEGLSYREASCFCRGLILFTNVCVVLSMCTILRV